MTEIDNPSPYHTTLTVRTGLGTGDVWIQRPDGSSNRGMLVSYGEVQRVWQISFLSSQTDSQTITINANHTYVTDEQLTSYIFQTGSTVAHEITNIGTTANSNTGTSVTIAPTQVSTQPDSTQQYARAETHRTITVSNHGPGAQSVSVSTTATWHGINIVGDERFIQRTIRAMEAVERGPGWAYDYIVNYLDYVKQHSEPRREGSGGHINVRTRTFYVYRSTYTHDVMWYASALVHEAVHARQYREYLESYGDRRPRNTFFATFEDQMRIEMEALDIQIRFLEEAGAPKRIIDMARSFIGTVWWR